VVVALATGFNKQSNVAEALRWYWQKNSGSSSCFIQLFYSQYLAAEVN
jgi:hypothetical protein